ncbi:uncharacterized protein C2845_PM01G08860 [Panicum miliaceum]|uniref:Uncharacterized protein n=1 Tax=Panicum miliaceum TaxID=4540 RepID=A0A3L6TR71_PANMI|nr:uncharacterized protein C2845_PM01G08860 [Panicum miliaceum]
MSRCFPYPPPGYVRNPVAVAEAETTAKLQKESLKAEKKKEKRSDKKALQQGETSKHSKHSHKKRKHEDVSTAGQEPKKLSKESVEPSEKSGLSEERGAPCFIQTVRDSPESSQDSSKRRKAVLRSPSQAKNGNVVRIKFKSNQDSQAVLEKPRVLEQPSIQQIGSVEPSPSRTMGRSDPQPVKMMQRVQHPPARDLQKGPQVPSEEIQRKIPAVSTKVAPKELRSAVQLPEAPQLPVLQKPKEPSVIKQQQEPIISVPKEEACFSGRSAEAAPVQEAKLSRSDRKKIRKAEKKEKKFSDLFVTWNPISLEMEGSDLGEQDWLLGSGTRNTDASMTCRASDCSVPFQSMEQQPSLQPRATFLSDLHIYQLPYVIPF